MRRFIFILMVCLIVASCAVQKDWMVSSGSKADATIQLVIEYSEFEKPILSEAQAEDIAKKRCEAWGYKRAESFDTTLTSCVGQTGSLTGCTRYRVTRDFQCVD